MKDQSEKKCPRCGQRLRFPKSIGGMVMACPSCGEKFHSDFKLGSVGKKSPQGIGRTVFELPTKIMERLGRYFSR